MPEIFNVIPTISRGSRVVVIGNPQSKSVLTLGRLAEVGPRRDVVLDISREHVMAIVGKRGSGKTHALGVLAEGLILASDESNSIGKGPRDHAVLLFDTLNIFQWVDVPLVQASGPSAETQRNLLTKWKLSPTVLQPAYWHVAGHEPVAEKSHAFTLRPGDLGPQDWGLLIGADIALEPMGQLLVTALDKVTTTGWRRGQRSVEPRIDYTIEELAVCIQEDPSLDKEFAPETRRAVRQRLLSFARSGLFSQNGTKLGELLKAGEMTIVLMARLPDNVRSLVTFLLIRRLLEERSAASEAAKHALIAGINRGGDQVPKTWVLIDEAQNIIPSRGASIANDILVRFVREGRNFGLSMAISTQQPSAIDNRIMAQVDTLAGHTLTVRQDINYVLANLKSTDPVRISIGSKETTLAESLRLVDVGHCLLSAVDAERTFFLSIRPRVTTHGGFEA